MHPLQLASNEPKFKELWDSCLESAKCKNTINDLAEHHWISGGVEKKKQNSKQPH